MSDQRLGSAIRKIRVRRGWRQVDLARRAGVGQSTISRIERGHLATLSVERLRAVAAVLDMRVDVIGRWRAGDMDRLLNAAHSQLAESVARTFQVLPHWTTAHEVSFAVRGERGIIDILAWHASSRMILVVELKTDLADLNELVGTLDRKRRLAAAIARDRGWTASSTSAWLVVAAGRTSRRRIAEHAALLRATFPTDGRTMRGWLAHPAGSVAALSMWPVSHPRTGRPTPRPVRRVRAAHPRTTAA